MLTISLNGIERLSGFGPNVLRGARRGVLAAAQSYARDVQEFLDSGRGPGTRSGHLSQSVGWRPEGEMGAVVYVQAPHAEYVEEGTKPHIIRPRRRKALKIPNPSGQGYLIRAKVSHPGTTAQPFFYADLPARRSRMLAAFSEELGNALEAGL